MQVRESLDKSRLGILIVDDHRDSSLALHKLLEHVGNDVRSAADGTEALRIAEAFRPDVILLDIGLPDIDGYEVAARIRQQPWSRSTTLIAVTGWGREKDRELAASNGFDHHLIKPVELDALVSLLASVKRNEGSPPASA